MTPIRVRVPATTANLGPGFDALGLALQLHNYVSIEAGEGEGDEIIAHGEGEEALHGRLPRVWVSSSSTRRFHLRARSRLSAIIQANASAVIPNAHQM